MSKNFMQHFVTLISCCKCEFYLKLQITYLISYTLYCYDVYSKVFAASLQSTWAISKGWWRWWWQLDYWSYKSCKAPVKSSPTNQHPKFFNWKC